MELFRKSAFAGFMCEMVAGLFGVLAAQGSGSDLLDNALARLFEWANFPGLWLGGRLFQEGGRATLGRDAIFTFCVQWFIFTVLAMPIILVVQHYRKTQNGS